MTNMSRNKLATALLWIWQLPQNLLGLLFMAFLKPVLMVADTGYAKVWKSDRMYGGISLGNYAFVSQMSAKDESTIRHEGIGHARQSRILGPLYLIAIGVPSILWAILHGSFFPYRSYYWFYTERWADKLGNIKR